MSSTEIPKAVSRFPLVDAYNFRYGLVGRHGRMATSADAGAAILAVRLVHARFTRPRNTSEYLTLPRAISLFIFTLV